MFKQILKPKDSEGHILAYQPRSFVNLVPNQAVPFVRDQDDNTTPNEFSINELVAQATGVSEIEKKNFHQKVEDEVLKRLKLIEEKAYAEAHALGLQDGRDTGFEETKSEINKSLLDLHEMVESLTNVKKRLLIDNEAHLVNVIFHIAKTIALEEIKANPERVMAVITKALENAQSEQDITLRINPADVEFVEKVKNLAPNPFERISNLRIESSDTITRGGCIVETNYGVIDATIEQRVKKVFEVLEGKVPKNSGEGT